MVESAMLAGTRSTQTAGSCNGFYIIIGIIIANYANSIYRNFMEKKLRRIEAEGHPPETEKVRDFITEMENAASELIDYFMKNRVRQLRTKIFSPILSG